jgi:hypothetical protein
MSDTAWLAGFWDGEGSIGIAKDRTTLILRCQLSSTCHETVTHILRILEAREINGRGYTYQERDPEKHMDAHYLRITGTANILKFARMIRPHLITKRRQCEIAIEWAERRIEKAGGLDCNGRLRKSGIPIPYDDYELSLYAEMCEINRRGPDGRKRHKQGRINV